MLVEEPGVPLNHEDIEEATIEGAVRRLRPKLMTVIAVLQSLAPVLWTTGIGSDLMKSIAAPIEGFKITSTIRALIMVPVFFALINVSALHHGTLESSDQP
ncbi:MAG: efflux RND transporter permease subunit [Terriglobia bacterium]